MKMNKLCKKMERNKLDKGNVYDENYQKENEAEEEESEEKEKVDKKYNSKKCVVRNWPSEKLKQDVSYSCFSSMEIIILKSLPFLNWTWLS